MFDLTDKVVLVTGASGGIGSAVAREMDKCGAKIILSGRNEIALQSVADTLHNDYRIIPCDLADTESVVALANKAQEAFGQVDVLVNNAGVTKDTLLMRMKDEDWDSVLNVNLKAAFTLTREIIKGMIKRRSGRVISLSSVVGLTGNAGQANYAASKAGLIGFSKSIAAEVAARGITVNCIAPGFISTAMTDKIPEQYRNDIAAKIPAGRFGTPEDVAAAAVFLASDEASYITGQVISVNGGMV